MNWLQKAKELETSHKVSANTTTPSEDDFNRLYDYLAPLNGWGREDYETWSNDLLEQPSLTMECLKALERSWGSGRYGCMNQSDWKESQTKGEPSKL